MVDRTSEQSAGSATCSDGRPPRDCLLIVRPCALCASAARLLPPTSRASPARHRCQDPLSYFLTAPPSRDTLCDLAARSRLPGERGRKSGMSHQDDIALMAHLMRRAGFGASRDELETRVAKGYDATVGGAAPPGEPAAGRSLYPAAPSAGCVAARRTAADGQRQLHVLPGEHEAPAGREDGAVLAPRVRHRQLEGRQLRPDAGADRSVPPPRHGQLPRAAG